MIELKHVTKRYGAKCAVNDISFTINKGEVLGFLGRNGAGKSTTMNMITGYISASEGQILIDGMDILEQPREAKRRIGYLPELPPLYMDMTVEEYLKFVCEIKEVRRKSQKAHLDDLYNLVKITDVRHRLIRNLSKGYKQRVGVAQALVGMLKDEIQSSRKSMLGAAMMLTTAALWTRNMRLTRLLFLLNSPPVFAYNLIAGSYTGAAIEVAAFCSFSLAVWRFDLRRPAAGPSSPA